MSQQPMNKTGGEEGSLATGVDTGGIAPGGTVHSAAKENPQAEEGRSFVNNQSAAAGGQDEDRIDTDGDGRTRDPDDTRPTDKGGRAAPVQR